MNRTHVVWTLVVAAACVLIVIGCSKEEDQAARKPNVVVVKNQPAQAPAQPLPVQQPARQIPPPPKPQREVGNSVLHGPGDYYRTVLSMPNYATVKTEIATVQHEIALFKAEQGRWPYSLKELEEWRGEDLKPPPSGYTYKYDANTGQLDVVEVR